MKNTGLSVKNLVLLFLLIHMNTFGQDSLRTTRHFGFTFSADQAFNFGDKVTKFGLAGKSTIGVSFTNKKRQFVLFAGGGIKGAKVNLYSARFQNSFIDGIQQNYTPIEGYSLDSLIAVKMNNSPGRDFRGNYAQYLKFGVMLNYKIRPTIQFYYGWEQLLMHDYSFIQFTDPVYSDIDYVYLSTRFFEIKTGIALPIKNTKDKNFCFLVNAGYKGVYYKDFEFSGTTLTSYTNPSFASQYSYTGKLTLSIGFLFWSNW